LDKKAATLPNASDILITGRGHYAGIIIFDLAITAEKPVNVATSGRSQERMDWLALAGSARPTVFDWPVTFSIAPLEWESSTTITKRDPTVVLQTATM